MAESGADHTEKIIDVALAEFAALRSEMHQKHTAEISLLALNVTTIGAILGLVISERVGPETLVIVPLISSAFVLFIRRQTLAARAIGTYIHEELARLISSRLQEVQLLRWEEYFANYIRTQKQWFIFPLTTWAIFPTFSVAILLIVAPYMQTSLEWFAWAVGATLSAGQLVYGIRNIAIFRRQGKWISDRAGP